MEKNKRRISLITLSAILAMFLGISSSCSNSPVDNQNNQTENESDHQEDKQDSDDGSQDSSPDDHSDGEHHDDGDHSDDEHHDDSGDSGDDHSDDEEHHDDGGDSGDDHSDDEEHHDDGGDSGDDHSDDKPDIKTQLATPILSISNNVVTWNEVEHATAYSYYVNEGEYLTNTTRSITLNKGETISVCAESSDDGYYTSKWSNPISYCEVKEITNYVTVAFRDADIPSVRVIQGKPYNAPTNPFKKDYTFDGWYVDAFYKEAFENGIAIKENTVLYAKWTPADYLNNTVYWVKASDLIKSPYADKEDGWKLIPLRYDSLLEVSGKKYHMFSCYVEATGDSTYLITNTTVHGEGSQYWKKANGQDNFTIHTAGYYKITFSVEYAWQTSDGEVHAHVDGVEGNPFSDIKSSKYIAPSSQLNVPVVTIDKDNDLASWPINPNASSYEYQIDNGEIISTTSNSAQLYQGSFITVRSVSDDYTKTSKWSQPYIYEYQSYPTKDYSYVYFYDVGINSFKVTNGTTIKQPADPVKFGFSFDGWYKELSCKNKFDFGQSISKNTVIYPKWTRIDETSFYHVIDQHNNKLGDLLYYTGETAFNEYKCKFETKSANTTIKVVEPEDYTKVYATTTLKDAECYTLYYSPEKLWNVGTSDSIHIYVKVTQSTYYFSRPNDGGEWQAHSVWAYLWENANTSNKNGSWPGEACVDTGNLNDYGEKLYSISFNVSKGYDRLIFNNHYGPKQTVDIDLTKYANGTRFYAKNASNDKTEVGTW